MAVAPVGVRVHLRLERSRVSGRTGGHVTTRWKRLFANATDGRVEGQQRLRRLVEHGVGKIEGEHVLQNHVEKPERKGVGRRLVSAAWWHAWVSAFRVLCARSSSSRASWC